ncbi:hypothetical protein [Caldalkalibacillus mannanilyticus]|uniref:hypothetical protein n=1 Tax=Caldalkalibacillus mannanilyticus TaxID=1418 RepID=UPI000468F7B8|nr:hypothetical protein [Caldalkalibacillus mannanilyticus]
MKNGAMVSPYSIWKVLIAGQASCFFGLVILILANFLIMPTPYFKNIVFLLLIGFCPSILFYYLTPRFVSYITIMNTLLITTMAVNMIGVTFLGSCFSYSLSLPYFSEAKLIIYWRV